MQQFDFDNIKFNIKEFYSLFDLVEYGFIQSPDSGCLVSDQLFTIGEKEIYKYNQIKILF